MLMLIDCYCCVLVCYSFVFIEHIMFIFYVDSKGVGIFFVFMWYYAAETEPVGFIIVFIILILLAHC